MSPIVVTYAWSIEKKKSLYQTQGKQLASNIYVLKTGVLWPCNVYKILALNSK